MQRTAKDIDITACAMLKSIIESGAPKEQWEALLIEAMKVHAKVLRLATTTKKEGNHASRN